MRVRKFFLLLPLWAAPSLYAASSPLESLRKTFHEAKGFDVKFTQEVRQDFFKDSKEGASGSIRFHRPSNLEWTYERPKKKVIRYQGGKLTMEEDGKTEGVRTSQLSIEESFSFLWGEANPKTFQVKSTGVDQFRVVPTQKAKAPFEHIDVTLKKGFVSQAVIQNKLEGQSILRFSEWKLSH